MHIIALQNGFGLENLSLVTQPSRPLDPHEVRIAIHAVALNYRDVMTVAGTYNPRQALPLTPCSDAAGEVIEVGHAVSRVAVGTRVATLFAQGWLAGAPTQAKLRTALGGPRDGVLADETVLHEDGVVPYPDHLSYAEAATLPCAALTAWSALEQADVRPGQTVLVQGTGGVSLFALQFARLRGARVIATSKSDEKIIKLRALGADVTINYAHTPDWSKVARAATGGEGIDTVIEVGGANTLAQSIRCTKPGGTIALIGVLSGVAAEVQLTAVLMQNIRIQGVIVGHREQMEAMHRAVAQSKLRPVLDEKVFDLEHSAEALAYMAGGNHFGKIVIRTR